ncbi:MULTISPECIES: HNH endonuclease [unclassified Micromonospora]|uniref:HNH endonuclease n=1 Tax=unclassified Micromonospora TaxID=2617518 RepID=UPI0033186B16
MELPDQRGIRGKKRLCSDDCRRQKKNAVRRAERFTIQCVVCHASVETADGQQRYCSVDCRRIRRRHPRDARVCGPCGSPFWPNTSQQIYCGRVCRRRGHYLANKDRYLSDVRLRKARVRGVTTEYFTSLEIYERDGWICGICHQHVDPKLEFPHPWSKSLDHRIPVSKGGPHSRENTQIAHLLCNLRKSDKLLEAV